MSLENHIIPKQAGATGGCGPPGGTGPTGAKGDTGAQGPTGKKGDTGAHGGSGPAASMALKAIQVGLGTGPEKALAAVNPVVVLESATGANGLNHRPDRPDRPNRR
ncbi:g5167 [Coccomyxa elongata]